MFFHFLLDPDPCGPDQQHWLFYVLFRKKRYLCEPPNRPSKNSCARQCVLKTEEYTQVAVAVIKKDFFIPILLRNNMKMNDNVLEASHRFGVKKVRYLSILKQFIF